MEYAAFTFLGVLSTLTIMFVLATMRQETNTLTLSFDKAALQRMENLRVLTEKDCIAKVINCSIATYEALQFAIQDGKQIALVDDENETLAIVELP